MSGPALSKDSYSPSPFCLKPKYNSQSSAVFPSSIAFPIRHIGRARGVDATGRRYRDTVCTWMMSKVKVSEAKVSVLCCC